MTLDTAIVMVAEQNLSLRAKFQEIPKATADVLTAGLRGNPLVFGSVDDAPYGQYSPTKPGDVGYGVTIIQPVDINRKRAYRVIAAQRARDVLQAQYQDAVRLEIETLYVRYVDVLAARENLRYVNASLAGLADVRGAIEQLVRGQEVSTLDLDRILVQIDSADVARLDAIAGLEKAKQNLAALLMLPSPEVAPLEIRGSIQSDATALADVDQLLELAQLNRPDLARISLALVALWPKSIWPLRNAIPTCSSSTRLGASRITLLRAGKIRRRGASAAWRAFRSSTATKATSAVPS